MSSPHRFVVRRQVWTPPDAAGIRRLLPEKWERVAECRTADEAYAKCAALTADARRTLNPFHLGGPALFYQTSLPAFALHDFLLDADITPPANSLSSNPAYPFWWMKGSRTFAPEQRDRVWAACDKLTLFDVIEEDDREAAHVVVEKVWRDDSLGFEQEANEYGWPVTACRRVRDAKHESRRREELRRVGEGDLDSNCYEATDEVGRVPYYFHVQTVPLVGESGGCHVVVRQGFDHAGGYILGGPERIFQWNLGARVPLVAFADQAAAADHLRHLVQRARRSVNPFAVAWRDSHGYMFEQHPLFEDWDESRHGLPNGLTIDDAVDAVRKLDLALPAPETLFTTSDWVAWYDRVVQWSPEYVDVIWGTFADFRLFEVIEVPLG